ncbi:DUF6624 domain-containing protein [Streptomyces olivaceoviridis]|uniref:DUF6624 domain-containing protein n=1 Tax=Streptomyces olivaceoviridis TaxID=1921 RepID=A0ABW7VLK1_STROI|nr:DUF6624 domain-containing protein [Streptomyces corchorusii]
MSTEPLRPHLARDLIARAEQASPHWSRRIRNELDGIQLGRGRHVDHVNARVLRRILAEHDWPGHRLVGRNGCRAAWQLALHADDDPELQRSAARLMHRAAQDDDAPPWQWAHLHDRALLTSGHTMQEYGTQYRGGPHGVELYPVREPATVNARRAELGLPPVAVATNGLRQRLRTPSSRINDATALTAFSLMAGAA